MDNYRKSRELSEKMQSCLKVYADMLGTPEPEKEVLYGFVPGLQMSVDEQALEGQLKKVEEGIFQVLFTGGFNAGKSTLLNALMKKDILPTGITPETSVITKIIFGQDESVTVYMKEKDIKNGSVNKVIMNISQFFEEYRVDQDNPGKFDDVDYAVLYQPEDGLAGRLVQLVDSPGTQNSKEDTLAARRFAESANAIVYLINSSMPFVLEDKEYILSHYANKHMKNVFFVCNRYDALDEQEQENLKKSVRKQLYDVFLDENGQFDEELFKNRVFYTDARHSLCARIGMKVKTSSGMTECDDSITGVPEFEAALGEYLTRGDRDKEAFRGYMPQLAAKYLGAVKRIDTILGEYRKGVEQLVAERNEFEGKKQQLEIIIEQIEESCRNCVYGIVSSAKSEYGNCMNRINANWDGHFENTKIQFGFTDMASLAWNRKNDAKVKEKIKPFADEIQSFVKAEINEMGKELSRSIDAYLKTLERQLNVLQAQIANLNLPISVDDLRQALLGGIVTPDGVLNNPIQIPNSNIFQIIMGIIGMDPEIVVEGIRGKTSNTSAVIEFIIKNVMEYIALYIVAYPIGIGMLIYRIGSMVKGMKNEKNSCAADILLGLKEDTVRSLQGEQERCIKEFETQLAVLTRAGITMADGIRKQVDDYSLSLNDTISKLENRSDNLETETERTEKIKKLLLESISEMNLALNGEPLTEEDIRNLAV